jgi:hypothetical protein
MVEHEIGRGFPGVASGISQDLLTLADSLNTCVDPHAIPQSLGGSVAFAKHLNK